VDSAQDTKKARGRIRGPFGNQLLNQGVRCACPGLIPDEILAAVDEITGLGVSGFMKMPYKDTRFFPHIERLPERYYPRNPRQEVTQAR